MESGEWRIESGEWRVESGEWRVESGERHPGTRRRTHSPARSSAPPGIRFGVSVKGTAGCLGHTSNGVKQIGVVAKQLKPLAGPDLVTVSPHDRVHHLQPTLLYKAATPDVL